MKAETDPDRERAARPTAPQPPGSDTPTLSREDERKRRELIKRIEKARGERDRMAKEAEDAQRIALAARTAAEEGQRLYEALTLGLEERGVEGAPGEPSTTRASDPLAPKKSRFVTRASERAAASKASPSGATIDPLRVALDLKRR